MSTATIPLDPVIRLSRDIKTAVKTLSVPEARYLVDAYYAMQANRIAASNQVRAMTESDEPHEVLRWLATQSDTLENQVKRALDRWTDEQQLGVWCKSITGIGPVLTAGLLAHIDITKANTAGAIWSFAGLSNAKWEKGQKRPWNASLKTLCWKIGQSFVKVSTNKNDTYGKIYVDRKLYEQSKNDAGELAEQAAAVLKAKKIGKETPTYAAYNSGKLPPSHIQQRAERYATKQFLADFHTVAYFLHFGTMPPLPYVFAHKTGHVHYRMLPNADLIPGLPEALEETIDKIRHQ